MIILFHYDDTLQKLGILHASLHFYASTTAESRLKNWYQYNVFKRLVDLAAVRSKAMVLLLLINC